MTREEDINTSFDIIDWMTVLSFIVVVYVAFGFSEISQREVQGGSTLFGGFAHGDVHLLILPSKLCAVFRFGVVKHRIRKA